MNNIEKQLRVLREVKPSLSLQERIRAEAHGLPAGARGFHYPLVSFRLALAGLVLLVFVGLGSGIVAAAKGSHPGSLLFPLKKAIVQTQINLTSDVDKKTALQKEVEETPTASPTAKPVMKVKEHEDENEREVEGVSTHATVTPRVRVSQHEDDDKKSILQKIFRHGDDDSSDN